MRRSKTNSLSDKSNRPACNTRYPKGTWRGINEECLNTCHEANINRVPIKAKKCDLCGTRNVPLFKVTVQIPIFQEPYHRIQTKRYVRVVLKPVKTR